MVFEQTKSNKISNDEAQTFSQVIDRITVITELPNQFLFVNIKILVNYPKYYFS